MGFYKIERLPGVGWGMIVMAWGEIILQNGELVLALVVLGYFIIGYFIIVVGNDSLFYYWHGVGDC